jgi:Ca2+-transporting ATPase
MEEAKELQKQYGKNEISSKNNGKLRKHILHIFSEPIYLLLSCAAIIYFALGEATDGAIMIAFVIVVIGIDVFQDSRTGNTLKKLKDITTPRIRVIRGGIEIWLLGVDLVPGDLMLISEGVKIPADGYLISAVGLCMDESILTGESVGVWKYARGKNILRKSPSSNTNKISSNNKVNNDSHYFRRDYCYTGTFVILGSGTVMVEKIGNQTEYGKIADKILGASTANSLLQRQMKRLAKQCTYIAVILFVLVSVATFLNLSNYILSERIIHSILAGVVLALSMIPGEFPVILSVFFSMGALRLAKKKALIRRLSAVETLGAVSVLCMDKTGTITQNKMKVAECYISDRQEGKFCRIMALACKEGTYDPLEKAMLQYGEQLCSNCNSQKNEVMACNISRAKPVLIKEYAFTNELKAMGQVWREKDKIIITTKGSPETIISLCLLSIEQKQNINNELKEFSKKGLRVIAIADRTLSSVEELPESLLECRLFFRGMIGLSDPPREGISDNVEASYAAGIRVVMITGDHPETAISIAGAVGIKNHTQVITGDEITMLSEEELRKKVMECNIFARVLPIHKMRIVKALKENGEIVAMTGDGVNDSPAQKIADIGIAMGKHGSEVCREAADLILLDDNFSTILDAVRDGRRIYQNIRKAIGYVFAFHIPIALVSLAAPILGIGPDALLLLPLQIVLLELVMDPTCSIALERQPAEDNIMTKPPRSPLEGLLSSNLLIKSFSQGLMIFLAAFSIYYILLVLSYPIELARTAGFAVLVISNILLVLVNCSETESIFQTIYKIRTDKGIWIVNLIIFIALLIMIYSPLHESLGFTPLSFAYLIKVIGSSIIAVIWYETVKIIKKLKRKS